MRRSVWLWLTLLVILLGVGAVAAWQLRQPLRQGLVVIERRLRPSTTIRFAVVGDNHGDHPIYRQILNEIRGQKPDFLLNLADATEYGTAEEFAAVAGLEKTLPFPVYHIVGSHDIKTDPSRQAFVRAFGQSPWGSQDIGRLHLIRLDNADRQIGFSDEQLNWLENDLGHHTDPMTIIAYHRPFGLPLAKVLGDDETAASSQTNERLLALLSGHRIAYIFTAHLHAYLPYVLGGIPAVVSGGGGDPAQAVLGGPAHNFFHYLMVTINPTTRNIDVIVQHVEPKLTDSTE